MNNKLILFSIVFLVIIPFLGHSQSLMSEFILSKESIGDKYFKKYAFADAVNAYKSALSQGDSTNDLKLKIAESYRMLNDAENASNWYGKVLTSNTSVDVKYMLHYADVLSSTKQYDEAHKWYNKYIKHFDEDERVHQKIKSIENRKRLLRKNEAVTINKAGFNSEFADFSPAFYENELVFISARPNENAKNVAYQWDNSHFLDIYQLKNEEVIPFSNSINDKYHEGPLVFYDNNSKLIFTRDNYKNGKLKKSSKGVTKLKLFSSQKNDTSGIWSPPAPLPFNDDEYSVGHPAISQDGKILYFVSDMPGGEGGTDIYKSEWSNNKWQQPKNLGANINTKGDEMFPFLYDNTELYFASNGHGGLGGLDVFVIDLSKGTVSEIHNLGAPINSSLDDFGLILSDEGDKGYFSSNREGGRNLDDIYAFETSKSFIQHLTVSGKVLNKANAKPLDSVLVWLKDDQGKTIERYQTDDKGNYSFALEQGKNYTLMAKKDDFVSDKQNFSTIDKDIDQWHYNLKLMKDPAFMLIGEILESGSKNPVDEVKVTITDKLNDNVVLNDKTNPEGIFNYPLGDKKLYQKVHYQIELKKRGYLHKKFALKDALAQSGAIHLKEYFDLKIDKVEIGTDVGKLIDLNPILFDVGKSDIRSDAAKELDKIVKLLKENPLLEIELGAHTDARGSDDANMKLSDERAKASAEYIISNGIEATRITGKGYGESQLLNECDDGVECTDEQHQENRRTAFKVVKF